MLETKIEALTDAIERLIAALDKPAQPVAEAPALAPAPAPEPAPAPAPDALNRTALQSKCLALVKADRSHKTKIVDLIAKHSGVTGGLIADIPDDALQAFADALEAL